MTKDFTYGYIGPMNKYTTLSFLNGKHPSKAFMPALGVKTNTLHSWRAKGFIDTPSVGTGTPLFLSGKDIVYLRCLVTLYNSGYSLKRLCKKGLENCVEQFFNYFVSAYDKGVEPEERYAVFRYVGKSFIDGEWELCEKQHVFDSPHISEGHGERAEPLFVVIPLKELSTTIAEIVTAGY